MKRKLHKHYTMTLLFSLVIMFITYFDVNAQSVCNNEIGDQGGFTYEYWKDQGTGCMTLGSGGTFSVEWNNINNLLARKGVRPGSMNQTVTYGADYQPNGNSYLCVYGWTTGTLVEYYIVDSWGDWRPPGGEGFMGQVNSDGGTYDIYRTQRVNQPSIEGTATFYQYWSVRTSKRTSGTISVANHFNAWESLGMNMGNLYEVSLTVEGYQSSGTADVYSMSMGTSNGGGNTGGGDTGGGDTGGGDTGGSANQGDGEYTLTVRARGTVGGEHLNVLIDNQAQADINLSSSWQEYEVYVNAGNLSLEYDNDSGDLDAQIDWIEVHGETRQAEDQETNTAVYQNDSCGGSFSEMMHCSGLISFGDITYQDSGNNGGGNNGGDTGGGTECNGYYALSFDDGPNSNTSTLLGILDNAGVKATFFPGGNQISSNLSAFQAMVNAGHRIENHSYTHSHMLDWSYQQVYDDIQQAQQAIQNAGGGTPTLFRPPYGEVNSTITSAANDLGLTVVTWDVDTEDWNGANTSAIVSSANNVQNGDVFLMHDGYSSTNNAIQSIVSNLANQGLCAGAINNNGDAVQWSEGNTGGGNTGGGNTGGGDTGSGNITVRAQGVVGDETISILVNGSSVGSFTLSTSYQNYSVSGNGTVRVEFTNDEGDRDVQVDYITIDGTTLQAEDQETNTAVYQDDSCGGSYSEMMHCGGYIEFGSSSGGNTGGDTGGGNDGGDTGGGNTGGTSCGSLSTWSSSGIYATAGTQVFYNGNIYENRWYSSGQNPESNSGQWQVWILIGPCQTVNTAMAEIEISKSITASSEDKGFKLYPNPSIDGEFLIQSSSKINKLVVFDLNGRIVKEIVPKQNQVHLSGMATGEYIAHIDTENKRIIKKLIVK